MDAKPIAAFSSLGCAELDLAEVLQLARQHGITAVELRMLGGTTDLASYFRTHFETPVTLASFVAASEVQVIGLDASCQLMANDAAGEVELCMLAPWAEALGGVPLRVFDGGEQLDDVVITRGLARWNWWQEQRAENGWSSQLMIETHDTLLSAESINRFLAKAPEGVRVLWDAFHTWSKGGEDPLITWSAIRDAVCHIHVKDGVVGGTEGKAFTHTLPGDGAFPMAALKACLQADGFQGPVSLEWGRKWHPYLPPLEDALVAAKRHKWW